MQRIKLITFDATNTLLKFRLPPWEFYTLVAQTHGFKGTPDKVKEQLKKSMRTMLEEHPNFGYSTISWQDWWRRVVQLTFKDIVPKQTNIESIANELIQVFQTSKCWETAAGTDELLDILRNSGKSIGIISNFDPRLHVVLHSLHLHNKLDFVLTSYEVGISKPEKEIFQIALQKLNKDINANESLHIGDDFKNDYEAARAAGWHALLIGRNKQERPPAPYHVFNNLVDLSFAVKNNSLKL